jgi:hypothetical protein
MGYHGLAASMAAAWDSMLSPVDARGLKPSQARYDAQGAWFEVDRAKRPAQRPQRRCRPGHWPS